ncbi:MULTISPECIES: restriction endonuclease subunit S [unclassified Agrobacterium]|jgi:type I restriction enzyme S subunit|uniref:restriction endonuclease subunit S n=1 Tax=unclassified Agrobacterium TaxID=2632611 RepID=UPI00244CF390|nr:MULTISPECIES: restriction endonuclease subunit S [unclassified Agrobacterium]MDH0611948.1 restriction endonuclease subunit S [Agrobacterium sp. GD03872]MDH0695845.1 restriction endonuclease subunit S [Agrobacterium sp. GD03871]MDH1058881.1 restriction endonuclease subunit S [Agrobacterium sp. GD03992]MDH2210972.1 restriction endonuclease subunit S [Agrobacterium sp. GD03643]MDH2217611.1 restriction endonuclease subunit S [Agrobacterium sp. GD03638]
MKWQSIRFGDAYSEPSRNGVYKSKEHHGVGSKIVNMGELFRYDFIDRQEMARLQMSDDELSKSGLRSGDLLFGRRSLVEAGAGKCSLVTNLDEDTTFESSIIRVRVKRDVLDPRFLFYWFKSPSGRGRIRAIVSGVNVKGIRGSDLQNIVVEHPNLPTQQRIASMLSAYDNLIENNRRRIALLEEAARLLYREWFVHFRFPGHETAKVADGLPEGWSRPKLGDVCSTNKKSHKAGKLPPRLRYIDIGSVSTGRVDQATEMAAEEAPGRARRIAEEGDTIWSNVRPNLRAYALVTAPRPEDVFSTGFTVLHAEAVSPYFLYLAVTTDDFVKHLENHATGVGYPAVRADDFERALVIKPTDAVMAKFHELCQPVFSQRQQLLDQNAQLTRASNLLLPRLMDGRIPV